MKRCWAIARRDSASYFYSWTGVLVLFFFSVLAGIFFVLPAVAYAKISLHAAAESMAGVPGLSASRYIFSSYFSNLGNMLMFVIPFLSMRAFAEERHLQTLELLFTYPVSDIEIVLGKFWGLLRFFVVLTLPTFAYAILLQAQGAAMDLGPFFAGYLGFLLLATAYAALGIFVSAITPNSILCSVVTFSVLVGFWILDWVAGIADGVWSKFFTALSPNQHFQNFTIGIVDLSDGVYFLFFTLYFLYLALRAVESRNWKG